MIEDWQRRRIFALVNQLRELTNAIVDFEWPLNKFRKQMMADFGNHAEIEFESLSRDECSHEAAKRFIRWLEGCISANKAI